MKRPILSRMGLFAAGTLILILSAGMVIRGRDAARIDRSLSILSLVSSLRWSSAVGELEVARSDALLWSRFGGIRESMVALENAWAALGPDREPLMQRLYVDQNPYPEPERHLLADPGDGSQYSAIHRVFQPRVREFLSIHEYEDILLVNPEDRVVYSFLKEEAFAADLRQAPWRETPLGDVVNEALDLEPGGIALSDFERYPPGTQEWALFLAAPIAGHGVLAFRISPERIGKHLARTHQQRNSASSMILAEGYRILGYPPWIEDEETVDPIDMEIHERANAGGPGRMILRRSDGSRILAAWEPGVFEGIPWVVVSTVDLSEVRGEGARDRRAVAVLAVLAWLALGALTVGGGGAPAMARHRV
jgi:methyl-accepting chemotaxis protein